MQIKNISYSQSKETLYGFGLKVWHKAGVEIELDKNEQPDKAFELAKQLVNEQLDITINQIEAEGNPVQVDSKLSFEPAKEDAEFEKLKLELDKIEFREDAEDYVSKNAPDWKMAVDIKKLISLKPNKK